MATSVNCRLVARLPRTAFKKGESGNPRGRVPGTRNKATVEVREMATRLIDDPEYRQQLRRRMIDGTAGAMEPLMWFYAVGRPVTRAEISTPSIELTDDELKAALRSALAAIDYPAGPRRPDDAL